MSVFALDERLIFPPPELAESNGLLAVGGDLSKDRLLLAYRSGIFPWFQGDTPYWWSPDPRYVIFPSELKVSKSMKQFMKKEIFSFSIDQAFPAVIKQCRNTKRKGQGGTWITDEMEVAYNELHRLGFAHSAECWENEVLVGGLYGVKMGRIFFGESMFSHQSNASKFAFIHYVIALEKQGVELIDCQVYTPHLESLGATPIPRKQFLDLVKRLSSAE